MAFNHPSQLNISGTTNDMDLQGFIFQQTESIANTENFTSFCLALRNVAQDISVRVPREAEELAEEYGTPRLAMQTILWNLVSYAIEPVNLADPELSHFIPNILKALFLQELTDMREVDLIRNLIIDHSLGTKNAGIFENVISSLSGIQQTHVNYSPENHRKYCLYHITNSIMGISAEGIFKADMLRFVLSTGINEDIKNDLGHYLAQIKGFSADDIILKSHVNDPNHENKFYLLLNALEVITSTNNLPATKILLAISRQFGLENRLIRECNAPNNQCKTYLSTPEITGVTSPRTAELDNILNAYRATPENQKDHFYDNAYAALLVNPTLYAGRRASVEKRDRSHSPDDNSQKKSRTLQ